MKLEPSDPAGHVSISTPARLNDIKADELLEALRATVVETLRPKRASWKNRHQLDRYLFAQLGQKDVEQMRCIYRDTRGNVIDDVIIADGDRKHVAVEPRQIVAAALRLNAQGFTIAHNHPSGRLRPSRADLEFTAALSKAAAALDLSFDDHLIISRCGVLSMRETGLLF